MSSEAKNTIRCSNLNYKTTEEQMKKHFESFGKVKSAKLITRKGYSKGFGFVEYENAEDAAKAVATTDNEFDGRKVKVIIAKPFVKNETKLFIGNLNFKTTQEEFQKHFESFGKVKEAKLAVRANGYSRGFGFVEYENAADAAKVIAKNGEEFEGRKIKVSFAKPQRKTNPRYKIHAKRFIRKGPKGTKPIQRKERKPRSTEPKEESETMLFVKNLKFEMTEEELKEAFNKYNPKTVTIIKGRKGYSKGFGFIEVATAEDQANAIKELNGVEMKERKVTVAKGYKNQTAKKQD